MSENGHHTNRVYEAQDGNLYLNGAGLYIGDGDIYNSSGVDMQIKTQDTLISSAELLALNATPQTVVTAPGAGIYAQFLGAVLFLDYNSTAYDGIAAGEDLSFKYTNGSGAKVSADVETTGFLDATADAMATAVPAGAVAVANAAIVLHLLSDEIATGNSPLKVRVFYREIVASELAAIA